MRYDENNDLLYFSTEQSTSYEERRLVIDHMARTTMELLSGAFKGGLNNRPEGSTRKTNVGAAIVAIVLFVGVIGACMVRAFAAAAAIAGGCLVALGVITLTRGEEEDSDDPYDLLREGSKLMSGVAGGVSLIAFGAALLIPVALTMILETTQCVVVGVGTFLVAAVIMNIASIISGNNKSKNVYTKDISARCIGYLKKTRSSNSNSRRSRSRNKIYIVGTPVFEYEYSMTTHKAFLNEFAQGKLDPAYGEQVEIGVNPDRPDDILYRPFLKKKNRTLTVVSVILAIFAVACFIGATII
jgi:ABC-type multidrug transport system fused ATPase/permease subunit